MRYGRVVDLRQFGVRGRFICDLALRDFPERRVFGRKFFQRFHERTIAAFELFHAAGDDVHQDRRIIDNFQRALQVVVSHGNEFLP